MTVLLAEVGDVRASGFEDPQAEQACREGIDASFGGERQVHTLRRLAPSVNRTEPGADAAGTTSIVVAVPYRAVHGPRRHGY